MISRWRIYIFSFLPRHITADALYHGLSACDARIVYYSAFSSHFISLPLSFSRHGRHAAPHYQGLPVFGPDIILHIRISRHIEYALYLQMLMLSLRYFRYFASAFAALLFNTDITINAYHILFPLKYRRQYRLFSHAAFISLPSFMGVLGHMLIFAASSDFHFMLKCLPPRASSA